MSLFPYDLPVLIPAAILFLGRPGASAAPMGAAIYQDG
jgi:hypothetical protein